MITIELKGDWDLLKQIPVRLDEFARKAPKIALQEYHTSVKDWINAGKAFVPRTGHLEGSIMPEYAKEEAILRTRISYAGYVEFGTGIHNKRTPWPIKARNRKYLKIPDKAGGFYYRKSVEHKGSRPFPYFFADFDHRIDVITKELMVQFEEVLK